MKTQVALALLMASAVIAQNTTAPQFKLNFWACTTNKNTYCTDGNCYTNITNPASPNLFNKTTKCSKNFNADIFDTAYPVTYNRISPVVSITKLEHDILPTLSLK